MARAAERPDSGAAQGAAPHTGRLSCRLSGGQRRRADKGQTRGVRSAPLESPGESEYST